jgi:hypothetical protein
MMIGLVAVATRGFACQTTIVSNPFSSRGELLIMST